MKKVITILLVNMAFINVMAQKKEIKKEIKTEVFDSKTSGKKKIRIEKNVDGKVEVIEREIDIKDGDSNVMILDGQLDNMDIDTNGKKNRLKVIIKGGEDDDFDWSEDESIGDRSPSKYRNFPKGKMQEFNFEMDRLSDHLAQIPYRFRKFDAEVFDNRIQRVMESNVIRSVDVFTNKPESNVLNIRFYAPKSGDVNITVIDLQGNVKAKESVKDFEGEYVGQIKINKGAKGTFFVIVSQGEDGVSRKIRID